MQTSPSSSTPALVLVTGSGRSGTSSLAGSLKRLGLYVPQPEVRPTETNPRGFYEPQWVMAFHKGHLKRLAVHNIDSRPAAVDAVAALVATGEPQRELRAWLPDHLGEPQVLVKDPHAFWFGSVWRTVCSDLGVDLRWLTALRHPAEVVGSREIAYLHSRSEELRLVKETANVAGWVHAALLTEREGRGHLRSFVRYADLLDDWRTALAPVTDQLRLELNADLSTAEHHPVDDFLEPSMRKSQLTWDDVRVAAPLRELAEEVWELLGRMVHAPHDEAAMARLDVLHERYLAMYADAMALTFDHTKAESTLAVRAAREAQGERVRELRQQVRRQARRIATLERARPAPPRGVRGLLRRLRRTAPARPM